MNDIILRKKEELELLENQFYNNVIAIDIFNCCQDKHIKKIFKLKNLKHMCLYSTQIICEKIFNKLSLYKNLEVYQLYIISDSIINNEISINDSIKQYYRPYSHFEKNLLIDNKKFINASVEKEILSILTNKNIIHLSILNYTNGLNLFILNNLPNTVEQLKINIKDKYLYIKLHNLPCSLKEITIIYDTHINEMDKNDIISNIKLPFDCKIFFVVKI